MPILSSPKLNIHVITGNNMRGKTTYLKLIMCIIVLTQIGIIMPLKIRTPIFEEIFFYSSSNFFNNKNSSLENELKETKKILSLKNSNKKLFLIDEYGKSASLRESTALSILLLKRIAFMRNMHCFFITHDYDAVKNITKIIKGVNLVKIENKEIISGVNKFESITGNLIEIDFKEETKKIK